MKNIPIVGFVQRYWLLLVVLGLLCALFASGLLAVTVKALLIVPIFLILAGVSALFFRQLLHRHSTDALVHDRQRFVDAWEGVPEAEKAVIAKKEFLVYFCAGVFLCGCLLLFLPSFGAGPVSPAAEPVPRAEEPREASGPEVPDYQVTGARLPAPAPKAPERPLTVRERWWGEIETAPGQVFRVAKALALYEQTRERYEAVEGMRRNGVPAEVVFVLHMRESTWSSARHLHEGSPLTGRTRWVPKGRPRSGSPPYTWEESAEDALYTLKDLENRPWRTVEEWMDKIEQYNGLGYRRYHPEVPSPYLVAGSNLQTPGKYVADGRFSRTAWDRQLGCMTVLKAMEREGLLRRLPY